MGTYPRAYLIKDYTKNNEKLSQMTEGQLGDHYYFSTHESAEFKNSGIDYTRNEIEKNLPDYRQKDFKL